MCPSLETGGRMATGASESPPRPLLRSGNRRANPSACPGSGPHPSWDRHGPLLPHLLSPHRTVLGHHRRMGLVPCWVFVARWRLTHGPGPQAAGPMRCQRSPTWGCPRGAETIWAPPVGLARGGFPAGPCGVAGGRGGGSSLPPGGCPIGGETTFRRTKHHRDFRRQKSSLDPKTQAEAGHRGPDDNLGRGQTILDSLARSPCRLAMMKRTRRPAR